MAHEITKDSRRKILSNAKCSMSTARCSALLNMGLGSTSLDAEPHAGSVSTDMRMKPFSTGNSTATLRIVEK